MFITGLRYRTPSHEKGKTGDIFLGVTHRRSTISSAGHGEGHGISPTAYTAPLRVTVHQLSSRNSALADMKSLPRT